MRFYALLLLLCLGATLPLVAQPALATAGQPSDRAAVGTLTAKGEGCFFMTAYLGNITLKGEGSILVSTVAKVKIEGEAAPPVVPTLAELTDFAPVLPQARPRPVPKTTAKANTDPQPEPVPPKVAKKLGYLLYTNFKGTLTVSENRFALLFHGTLTSLSAYGIGSVLLVGDGTYLVGKDGMPDKTTGTWIPTPPANAPPKGKKDRPAPVLFGDYRADLYQRAKPVKANPLVAPPTPPAPTVPPEKTPEAEPK